MRFISLEKYDRLKRYKVLPGDILISIMATVGRVAIVPDDLPCAINSKHLAAITLDKSKALPEFIAYNLHSNENVLRQLNVSERGAIMAGLNLGIIKEIKIKIPPMTFQIRFEEIKTQIDKQKSLIESQIEHSESLFQSLLQKAFTGELVK